MLNQKYILLGLAYSLPGLALAAWMDRIIRNSSEVLQWLRQFGFHPSFGALFGMEPYIYYIFGIDLGFLLFILFDRAIQNQRLKRWIWDITLILFGFVIMAIGDALLGITFLALGPAMIVFEHAVLNRGVNKRSAFG